MATYTLTSTTAMRQNGPRNDVESIGTGRIFTRNGARGWKEKGTNSTFTNFAALLAEYPSGVRDVKTPHEQALEYFGDRVWTITPGDLVATRAKQHAIVIIEEALKAALPKKVSPVW